MPKIPRRISKLDKTCPVEYFGLGNVEGFFAFFGGKPVEPFLTDLSGFF